MFIRHVKMTCISKMNIILFHFLLSVLAFSSLKALGDVDFENDEDDDFHVSSEPDMEVHEAMVGGHQEAEELMNLEPDEAKRRLKILISKMDIDKNGTIEKNELIKWIVDSFKKNDENEAKGKIQSMDENSDNKLSFDEYLHKTYGYRESEVKNLKKENNQDVLGFVEAIEEDKDKFNLADSDKDEFLSLEELPAFIHPNHYPNMKDYRLAIHLKHFDKNKDGQLSLEEFNGNHLNGEALNQAKEQFDSLDKNKNAVLDKEEILDWGANGHDSVAEEEVVHLFEFSDKNKDGVLSVEEILDDYETFMSSHATDYGRHLHDLKDEL